MPRRNWDPQGQGERRLEKEGKNYPFLLLLKKGVGVNDHKGKSAAEIA